ncbi:hypothetical protein ACFC58_27130 [Kitasatospora purpeofusca]|uniref:hypothetical protein n=1 Tax=Kitasatospora purpeofusca TaxID=67352 RepID=UPI0035D7CC67
MRLLPIARSANGDAVFWLCDPRDPDSWDIVVFRHQSGYGEERWIRFEMRFAEFLLGTLSGTPPSPFSDASFVEPPHAYQSWRQHR